MKRRISALLFVVAIGSSSAWSNAPIPPFVCSDASCAGETQQSKTVKWHPGHYLLGQAGRHRWPEIYTGDGAKYFEGAMILYGWGELCTSYENPANNCNWSTIRADIEELKAHGKRAWIFIRDKEFNHRAQQRLCAPADMFNSSDWAFQFNHNGTDKCTVRKWDAQPMEKFIRFLEELAYRFDSDPAVEGVVLPETALGLGKEFEDLYGYNHESYKRELERRMARVSAAWRTSQVHQASNWLSGDDAGMKSLFDQAAAHPGSGIGGPDPLPNTTATQFYPDYASRIPLHLQGQRAARVGPAKEGPHLVYPTLIQPLRLNYFFWPFNWGSDTAWHFETKILPAIKADVNAGRNVVKRCPESVSCN